jgi:hypothetical protein
MNQMKFTTKFGGRTWECVIQGQEITSVSVDGRAPLPASIFAGWIVDRLHNEWRALSLLVG